MTLREVIATSGAILVSLGGAGTIIMGFSGFIGRVWADRGLAKQRNEYEILTRKLQVELDAATHLRKLRTEHEFTTLQELWERIANLQGAFHHLPRLGGSLQPAAEEERRKLALKSSVDFLTALSDAQQFVNRRALSVPKNIVDTANRVLRIAHEEAWGVQLFPASEGTAYEPLFKNFYEERAERIIGFRTATEQLEGLVREHIHRSEGQ